jgi:hypothetical protein
MKKFLLVAFSLALMAAPAWGADAPIFPGNIRVQTTSFVEGTDSAGTYKTVFTGAASGSKVLRVMVSTTDTVASHLINLQYSTSTSDHCATATTCAPMATSTPDLGAGYAVDTGLSTLDTDAQPTDSDGNAFWFVNDDTDTLEVTFSTALTAGTRINIIVFAVDF